MSRLAPILCLVGFVAATSQVHAAVFSAHCDAQIEKIGGCTIRLSGPIEAGDAERLAATIAKPPPAPGFYRQLVLNSPGGSVAEALKLADVVRRALLQTANYRSRPLDEVMAAGNFEASGQVLRENYHQCLSACFIVWAAGTERNHISSISGSETRTGKFGLGLHRPYFAAEMYREADPSTIAKKQQDAMATLVQHLRREAIPDLLIEEMVRRSSREIYWVDSYSTDNAREISKFAPWFEEVLIARCGFDPVRDRDSMSELVSDTMKKTKSPGRDQKKADYFAWRQGVNACWYNSLLVPAQRAFRR